MRRIVSFLVPILVFAPFILTAQNRITSLSVGSGQTPVSSGVSGIVRFESSDSSQYGELAVQQEQAWLAWGRSVHGRVSGFFDGSVGYFQGAPWAGPYIALATKVASAGGDDVQLGMFQWPAFFANEPDSKKAAGVKQNGVLVGYLASMSLSWKFISVSYGFQKFLDNPWNTLPGVAINLPLTNSVKANVSVTQNVDARKPMYYIGATWTPPHK